MESAGQAAAMKCYTTAMEYELAIAIAREKCVRRKQILPSRDRPEEARWAAEGDIPDKDLDTIKRAS